MGTRLVYLLSALLQVVGCALITPHDLVSWEPLRAGLTLGSLQLYEFLLVFACTFLLTRRRSLGDGMMLLYLEGMFLFSTFLVADFFQIAESRAVTVSTLAGVCAAARLLWLGRLLGVRPAPCFAMFFPVLLALNVALPSYLGRLEDLREPTGVPFYVACWVLAAGALLLLPHRVRHALPGARPRPFGALPIEVQDAVCLRFSLLCLLATAVHLLGLSFALGSPLYLGFLSPLLLAGTAWVYRAGFRPDSRLLLPAMGLALAWRAPAVTFPGGVTPFALTLFAFHALFVGLYVAGRERTTLTLALGTGVLAALTGFDPLLLVLDAVALLLCGLLLADRPLFWAGCFWTSGAACTFLAGALGGGRESWGWSVLLLSFLLFGCGFGVAASRKDPDGPEGLAEGGR